MPEPNALLRTELAGRLAELTPRIPESVRLIAVSKTFSPEVIRAAYAEGLRDFGENKIQEALSKQSELDDLVDVVWHFIGHVQSNKSRKVIENFDWIHSVDSLKLATRMDRQAAELNRAPKCCLQVKVMSDPSKDGFEVDELMAALPALDKLTHISICGLMVILPYGLSAAETQAGFATAKKLAVSISDRDWVNLKMSELSMGMSGDFEAAIAQGATLIRIGSGLFGQR
ncbi:MAG: YggS family pyridoxal phosphate-dependent enzyme [Cyanobacteria bacterium J06648_10]